MKRRACRAYILLPAALLLATFRLHSGAPGPAEAAYLITDASQDLVSEELYLHIDRDKYIAGEDIWFSMYAVDGETGRLSARSAVAYVELLNPWNVPVLQRRLQLTGGRGAGNLALPDSVSSGTYTIRAYTNWMKNFLPDNCYMHDLDVLNPFRNSGFRRKTRSGINTDTPTAVFSEGSGKITMASDSIFGRREKVTVRLGPSDFNPWQSLNYDISISVTQEQHTVESKGIEEYLSDRKRNREALLSGIKPPLLHGLESEGHYLSLIIKHREADVSDSSAYLFMSIRGKVAEFGYAGRDSNGRFTFILPVDSKMRNLILQPENADNNMILEIEPSFSRVLPAAGSFKDSLNDRQTDLFSELSFNYQAGRIYGVGSKKEPETDDGTYEKKRRFYGIPEMEVLLDDYIQLPSMQEVFFELLPGINLKSRGSEYEMQITNPMTGINYIEPPLVMIDGVIINDLKVLADLNPEIVEKIEVVKTPYLIGELILYGIVNVITLSGDFSNIEMPDYAVILPYRVVEKPSSFNAPDHSAGEERLKRTPDLRNTLYWNPSVRSGADGKAEILFWTSDLPGRYVITIQGMSRSGEKVSLNRSIVVR